MKRCNGVCGELKKLDDFYEGQLMCKKCRGKVNYAAQQRREGNSEVKGLADRANDLWKVK